MFILLNMMLNFNTKIVIFNKIGALTKSCCKTKND